MILPGTGESQTARLRVSGTMRSMVEGQVRLSVSSLAAEKPRSPLHHLRWSPSPEGED
jgi:hypothetical protein